MKWKVEAKKNNSEKQAEFYVREGHITIAFVNGFIDEADGSIVHLNNIESTEIAENGMGTALLLAFVTWGKEYGAECLVGDFRPTGDKNQVESWYNKRGIFVVNNGYDIFGTISQIINACLEIRQKY